MQTPIGLVFLDEKWTLVARLSCTVWGLKILRAPALEVQFHLCLCIAETSHLFLGLSGVSRVSRGFQVVCRRFLAVSWVFSGGSQMISERRRPPSSNLGGTEQ